MDAPLLGTITFFPTAFNFVNTSPTPTEEYLVGMCETLMFSFSIASLVLGTTPKQKMIVGTLTSIAGKIKKEKMTPPANIIIGEVVKLHKTIGWKK